MSVMANQLEANQLQANQSQANQSQAKQLEGRSIADVELLEEGALLANSSRDTWDRVKNVVWIKGNTLYNEALGDWEREIKVKGERLVRREKRSDELTNQIYNVVGFFSVFQGVILTAVTQLTQSSSASQSGSATPCVCSRPLCGKVWFPILLSGLAAFAAVFGIWLKFRDISRVESLIFKERREQTLVVKRESELRERGENFRFRDLKEPIKRLEKSHSKYKSAFVIGGVLAFTFIFILSYFVILCDKWVIKGWD